MTKKLDPANWKPNPDATTDKQPQETYSTDVAEADPAIVKEMIAKLEDRMLDADVGIASRAFIKQAISDEMDWLNPDGHRSPEYKLFSFKPTILRQGLRTLFNFLPFVSSPNGSPVYFMLTCDSFEHDRAEILNLLIQYLNARYEQAKSIGSISIEKWRQTLMLAHALQTDATVYDKMIELADAATFELESNLRFGSQNAVKQDVERIEQTITARLPKKRKDKGKRHLKNRTGGWRTQAEVAYDFNEARFRPSPKARPMGACPISKIKEWDRRHPDVTHRNRFGYYAELRINPELKAEYSECLRNWNAHWAEYRRQFSAWSAAHPRSPRSSFRFDKDHCLEFHEDMSTYTDA